MEGGISLAEYKPPKAQRTEGYPHKKGEGHSIKKGRHAGKIASKKPLAGSMDHGVDLALAAYKKYEASANPEEKANALINAANYINNILYAVVLKGKKISPERLTALVELAVKVIDKLSQKKEDGWVYILLARLYQAKLSGMVTFTASQAEKLKTIKFDLNGLYGDVFKVAWDAMSKSFTYTYYYVEHGKVKKAEINVGENNGIAGMDRLKSTLFVLAVMYAESGYNPDSINGSTKCTGLMQVDPGTGQKIGELIGPGPVDLRDASTNVKIGTAYLRLLGKLINFSYFGNGRVNIGNNLLGLVLFAYAGVGVHRNYAVKMMAAVLKAGGVIEWFKKGCYVNNQFNRDQDNRWQYVIKVMGAFTALQNHYSQCELGIFLNPDTGTYERLRIIPQCPRPSKN